MASSPEDLDPYGNYYFALEINKSEVAHFVECSGLKSTTAVFEIEEGGLNGRTHKLPGQAKWENLILKYATSADFSMLKLRDSILQEKFGERISGSISLKNNRGETIRRYSFKEGWAVTWEGPSFSGSGSDLAIETLEIAHNGLEIS